MSLKNKTLLLTFLVTFLTGTAIFSQDMNTLYYMYGVPQSNLFNPAHQPASKFYLGLPGLSPFGFNLENSSLNTNNILIPKPDSLVTVLHPSVTDLERADFVNGLKDINYIRTNANIYLLNMGLAIGSSWYFNFHVAEKIRGNIDYPKDLAQILMFGLKNNQTYDISGFGGRLTAYGEIGFGASYKISEDLVVGGKLKALLGQYDIGMKKQDITFDAGVDQYDINANFELVGSMPFLQGLDSTNILDSIQTNFKDGDKAEYIDYLKNMGNLGFGLDAGVNYSPISNLTLSASIIDLGIIRWKSNTQVLSQNSTFTFYGLENLKLAQDDENEEDTTTFFTNLVDSLKSKFVTVPSSDPYSTFLSAKVYIGAKYNVTEKVAFGFLSRTEIYRKKLYPQVTLSANVQPIRAFSASASYTLLTGEYSSFGLGMNFKTGPFNWYFISDNIPTTFTKGMPVPLHAKGLRMMLGFNLTIGTRGGKKGGVDIPLME